MAQFSMDLLNRLPYLFYFLFLLKIEITFIFNRFFFSSSIHNLEFSRLSHIGILFCSRDLSVIYWVKFLARYSCCLTLITVTLVALFQNSNFWFFLFLELNIFSFPTPTTGLLTLDWTRTTLFHGRKTRNKWTETLKLNNAQTMMLCHNKKMFFFAIIKSRYIHTHNAGVGRWRSRECVLIENVIFWKHF